MHERGACKCEVKFPALMQPRLVRRPELSYGSDDAASPGRIAHAHDQNSNDHGAMSRYNQTGQGTGVPPMYQEVKVGDTIEVCTRLPSLYAAEWTNDHAELHENGQCSCNVSFKSYQPQDMDDVKGKAPARHHGAKSSQSQSAQRSSHGQGHAESSAKGAMSDKSSKKKLKNKKFRTNKNNKKKMNKDEQNGKTETENTSAKSESPPDVGQTARWSMYPPHLSILDEILGPIDHLAITNQTHTHHHDATGRPVDIQTAHYYPDNVPISGNPIVDGPSYSNIPTIVEYSQPSITIAGFPLGAGPEGQSHAGDFEACKRPYSDNEEFVIYFSTDDEDAEPVRRRRSNEF